MVTLIVLGTAQDGGVPQLGCWHRYCARARRDPSFARTVACLGLVDESAQRTYLIDATPDIRAQWMSFHNAYHDAKKAREQAEKDAKSGKLPQTQPAN